MSFRGDISSFSLGDVFQNLAANQKTGTLRVQSGDTECLVLFREGKAVSCSDQKTPSIGEWLVDKEVITREQLDEAQRRYKRAKKKSLGEILHDMEELKLEDFKSYLASLIQESIYELLSFQEGTFEFLEGLEEDSPNREPLALKIAFQAQSLLMEAARRSDDWQKIRRQMPSENEIYLVPPASRERLLATTEDEVTKDAVQLLDGTRTLKKVIARMPHGRFDACRAIAQLIADKKVRPLDASELPRMATGKEDPKEIIACLKTILEREPNNRKVLERVAEVSAQFGSPEDSATHWKRLAISFLEDGDLAQAERCFTKTIELNSKDIVAWQKLRESIRRGGDPRKLEAFGARFAEHFKRLGLMEVVRDHLTEMVQLVPGSLDLQLGLAEARFSLGQTKECVASLFTLGMERLNARHFDEAERIFGEILKYETSHAKAKKIFEDLRSGKLVRRRALWQRAVRRVVMSSFALVLLALFAYDCLVRYELFSITRSVYAESRIDPARQAILYDRISSLEKKHPLCYPTIREAKELRAALNSKARARTER